MARIAAVLAFLSLFVTAALAAVVLAPDRLPSSLVAQQPRVTPEQMQNVTQRLDRIGGELERLRQAQQEQAKALAAANQASNQNAKLQQAIDSLRQDVAALRQNFEALQSVSPPTQGGSRQKRR